MAGRSDDLVSAFKPNTTNTEQIQCAVTSPGQARTKETTDDFSDWDASEEPDERESEYLPSVQHEQIETEGKSAWRTLKTNADIDVERLEADVAYQVQLIGVSVPFVIYS